MVGLSPNPVHDRRGEAFDARDLDALLRLYEPDALLVAIDNPFGVASRRPSPRAE